jgi:hypothetical protein
MQLSDSLSQLSGTKAGVEAGRLQDPEQLDLQKRSTQ